MQLKKTHPKFLVNAYKNVLNLVLFFFLSFFLLITIDKFTRSCFCRQDLRICVLQISWNNINHPELLMINYVRIQISFLSLLFWSKHAFIWKLQRTEFLSKVCKFALCKLCKIIKVILIRNTFEGFPFDQNILWLRIVEN